MDGWIYAFIAVFFQSVAAVSGRRGLLIATVCVACLPILLICTSGHHLWTTPEFASSEHTFEHWTETNTRRSQLGYSRYFLWVSLQALTIILIVHAILRWRKKSHDTSRHTA